MEHADPFIIKCRVGEVITLKAFGDVHHLLIDSDEERFISDLKERTTEKTYFIDLGDSLDAIGPGHKYFSLDRIKPKFLVDIKDNGKVGQAKYPILDAELEDLCRIINKYTKPDEWLGHLSGNHPLFLLNTGLDLTQNLCARLRHRYLGYQAYVPVWLKVDKGVTVSLMIFACHGFGGAGQRWEGSGLNAYIAHSFRYEGWDVALYGHRHDKWVKVLSRIYPAVHSKKGRWIKEGIKLICQTGTYLRTLSHSKLPSYSEKRGMSPRPLGCISIQFKVRRYRDNSGRGYSLEFVNI